MKAEVLMKQPSGHSLNEVEKPTGVLARRICFLLLCLGFLNPLSAVVRGPLLRPQTFSSGGVVITFSLT